MKDFDFVLNTSKKVFFTSDTHYSHKNIVLGVTEWDKTRAHNTCRKFDTVDKMNETIVNGINNVVGHDDILIHLGDWSFGGFDNIELFRNRLVCQEIYLILGNHDEHIKSDKGGIQRVFTQVMRGQINANINYVSMVLSHYPLCSWQDMNKGWIHLFGHVHLNPSKALMKGKALDVGMDGSNFTPYSLPNILKIMNTQPVATSVLPSDHHVEEVK